MNIANPIYMEPVEGVEKIPKGRWRLVSPSVTSSDFIII